MQVEWLQFVVGKAQKIFYYEMFPRTDEQYSIRRIGLIKSLNRAYKKIS